MRRLVDHVLCALPFETKWFREHGCRATYVGHPFFDEVHRRALDTAFVQRQQRMPGPLVLILPGSRTQEVQSNLRWFLAAAERVRARVPNARFAIAAFKPHQAELCRRRAAATNLPIEVHVDKTPELMRVADCCMSVSGSVSLELLHHARPTVILYWISRFAYFMQNRFRRVKYITLVNLLAADELFPADTTPFDPGQPDAENVLFPEYLTWQDKSAQIAAHLVEWLTDARSRAARVAALEALREQVGHPGASSRAAEYILAALAAPKAAVPPPHFKTAAAPESHRAGALQP
jgi:lipid-A-disaccharide synthase